MTLHKASSPKPTQLLGWALPSPPQGYSLFQSFPEPPFPHFRPPRVDSPSVVPPLQPVHLAQVSFVIPAFNSNFTLDLELNQ